MRVIAHRGASAEAPENTEAAVRLALQQGADAIECDVQLTADGVAVVLHDADLARVGGSDARVLDQLAKAVIGRPVRMPGREGEPAVVLSLSQWLDLLPAGVLGVIELKQQETRQINERLVKAVGRAVAGARRDVAAISFGNDLVRMLRDELPGCPVGPIRNQPVGESELAEVLELARGCAVLKKTVAEEERVRQIAHHGHEVWSYALDEEKEIADAIEHGVTGLISNRPSVARQVVDSRS